MHTDSLRGFQAQPPDPTNARFQQDLEEARKLRKTGDFARAERLFHAAAEQAKRTGTPAMQCQAMLSEMGCQIRQFKYGAALQTSTTATALASIAQDNTVLGAIASNVSSVYFQLGDFSAAEKTAVESVSYLRKSPRKEYLAKALMVAGDIEFGLGRHLQGSAALTQAADVAKEAKLPDLECLAANHLGVWLVLTDDLPRAETLLRRALDLSLRQHDDSGIAESHEHLAELEWRKGGIFLQSALSDIDLALATTSGVFKTNVLYYPIHIRGQILLSLGQKDKALSEFRRAVVSADTWRQSALPGDTTNTQTVVQLDSVYKDYAQLAADLALERDDHALARDAFEVLARNRAASLREQLTRSYSGKLLDSPEYFDLLQQLQAAQASATLESDSKQTEPERAKLNQIRARLSDLENHIGLNQQNLGQLSEKKGQRNSLKGIQARLSPSEALLSFSLGEHKSFLWTVTSEDVRLYDLPKQETIAHQAEAFSHAVFTNSQERAESGRALSRSLFANIAPSVKRKRNWLLTPDGALLNEIPFASLPAIFEATDKPLIASHTLRTIPTASLLVMSGHPPATGRFVGVADPIYNLADSRRDRSAKPVRTGSEKTKSSSSVLGRLVGSETEIKASAEKCGLPQVRMLVGKEASSLTLRQVVAQSPEILHFAVHVISPKDFPQEAAIALSLTRDNLPELLTAESAATYRVPGSLVVLSGCSSQQGDPLPGAGVIGLSRGWLLAGAAAVVVSAWPTPDASGSFFSSFYNHYRQASGSVGERAAIALQQTQLDMQRSHGYQSEPNFWAAYSIISKE